MSPHARDRAREKRRNQKRQSVLAQRELDSRRNKQVLGIVLALVVIIGGFVALTFALNKDNKTVASSGATAKASGQPSAAASAQVQPVAGCVAPPAVPLDKRSAKLPDKKIAAGKTFVATVMTNCGVITMELDGTKAPQTVASFLGLSESGYWVESPCHRLATTGIFVLQCGDPTGTGSGTPGYGFGVENPPANATYPAGTLAMARTSDPKSNGGQFFIVYKQTVLPDPTGYSIFGKITSGMDIVDKIAAAGAAKPDAQQNTAPLQPISILAVNVTEKKA
ncbi:MAG TPA: peptidylprolyl isomerase [Dermatophilaceae bacterium]|nr:peptidylprolyl isomerase [Dermatophilaceae bacterium]